MDKASQFPESIPCEWKPHPRNRSIRLSYRAGRGFLVTYPPRTSKKRIQDFLDGQKAWMISVREKYSVSSRALLRQYLKDEPMIYLGAQQLKVEFAVIGGWMKTTDDQLHIHSDITESVLIKKLRSLARAPLEEKTMAHASEKQIEVSHVTIRNQTSRWGSCSSSGTISLNWRLILMRPTLQEHIILHELAHRIHPNHSSAFWKLLRSWDCHFEEHVAELKCRGKIWIQLGH